MKASRWVYAVLIVGLGVWWMFSSGGGEESKIRGQLEEVREIASKDPGEKALDSAARSRRLGAFLAPDFVLRLDPIGQEIRDLAALARPFVGLRQSVETLDVAFSDVEIELTAGDRKAVSTMVAVLNARGSQPQRGRYRVDIRWVKEGKWLIEEMQVTEMSGLF